MFTHIIITKSTQEGIHFLNRNKVIQDKLDSECFMDYSSAARMAGCFSTFEVVSLKSIVLGIEKEVTNFLQNTDISKLI